MCGSPVDNSGCGSRIQEAGIGAPAENRTNQLMAGRRLESISLR